MVRTPRIAAVAAVASRPGPAAQQAERENAQREKLERMFDNGELNDEQHGGRDEVRHTLPETDLLTEIGVGGLE